MTNTLLISLLSVLSINQISMNFEDCAILNRENIYVQTQNGTNVLVNQTIAGPGYNPDDYNAACDAVNFSNIRFRGATVDYNCHSYAWYRQRESESEYYMGNPSAYWNDSSYVQIYFNTVMPGDKVCYYDSSNNLVHSGVVVSKLSGTSTYNLCPNSDLIIIESKWGPAGLYRSRGDHSLYTPNNGGTGRTLKFYRRHWSHSHSYLYEQISHPTLDEYYHFKYCSSCTGFYESHNFTPYIENNQERGLERYVPASICVDCGYISYL